MYRYYLAIRYLMSRPINLLGMIGIMLGVWALIVVVSIFSGYLLEVQKHLQSSTADLTVTRLPDDARYSTLRATILADPNVAACAPRLVWQGLMHPFGDAEPVPPPVGASELGAATPLVSIIGVDPVLEHDVSGFRDWLDAVHEDGMRVEDLGAPLAPRNGLPALLMSEGRMVEEGVQVGDHARLTTGRMTRQHGEDVLDFQDLEFAIGGGFETSYSAFDSLNVFVDIEAMRALCGRSGTGLCNEVAIRLHDPSQAETTAERLQNALCADMPSFQSTVEVLTWSQANLPKLSSIDHQHSLMKLVLFVIMIVAAFLMYATLSMMVTEKTHDIGILTAMGASPRGVMTVFLACGLAIVLCGTVLGLLLGGLSSIYLDAFNQWLKASFDIDLFPVRIYHLKHVPYALDPYWMLQVAGLAAVVGVLVSGLPAWRAARHDPLASLRNE